MLYTRKGDAGTTKTFACDQRISKSSAVAEALGQVDEINSYLGLIKVHQSSPVFCVPDGRSFSEIINTVQQHLFIVQAELAGADKHIDEEKVKDVEGIVDTVEKDLPPITTFFVSGGSELAALFDFARTMVRRAERRVVAVAEAGEAPGRTDGVVGDPGASKSMNAQTLAYMNRLSSLFYALARYANHKAGVSEQAPTYK